METKKLSKLELKSLIKQGSINNGTIYNTDGKKYKIDREFLEDFVRKHVVTRNHYGVDREQIEWLMSKQKDIKHTTLPNGIITYEGVDVGVIYPRFFYGYKNFHSLPREEEILILKNLRTAIANNEELLRNGIFNENFLNREIIYSGDDVQLINIDGKYIKKEGMTTYSSVYSYFLNDLYKMLNEALLLKCRGHASEYSRCILALRDILNNRSDINTIDCPRNVLDEIEKERILKR